MLIDAAGTAQGQRALVAARLAGEIQELLAAGDTTGARALFDAMGALLGQQREEAPPAGVVDLAAERARRAR